MVTFENRSLEKISTPYRRALAERSFAVDFSQDATGFGALYAPDATFKIGAMPTVSGPAAIEGFVANFFSMGLFSSLSHEILEVWDLEKSLIFTALANYKLKDGSVLTLDYVKILEYSNQLISTDRIFIDTHPLLALAD